MSGGVSRSHPNSSKRLTALIVPMPSKCSARADGSVNMEWFQVPSGCCVTANVSAGRCVNGRDATWSLTLPDSLATSVIARYLMGADACSISQMSGNRIGGDGGAVTGVSGVAVAVVLDGVEGMGGRGGVTKSLFSTSSYRTSVSLVRTSCVRAGKDSSFDSLR